jgi:hypothetical protein
VLTSELKPGETARWLVVHNAVIYGADNVDKYRRRTYFEAQLPLWVLRDAYDDEYGRGMAQFLLAYGWQVC